MMDVIHCTCQCIEVSFMYVRIKQLNCVIRTHQVIEYQAIEVWFMYILNH